MTDTPPFFTPEGPEFEEIGNQTAPGIEGDFRTPDYAQSIGLEDTVPEAPKVPTIPANKLRGTLTKPLTEMYQGVGGIVLMFDQPCGTAIVESAEKCAETLSELAQRNDAVRRALLALVETNAWGAVVMAHAPIMLAVVMHHTAARGQVSDQEIASFLGGETEAEQ